ncbi:scarecrow-like protein 15 [Andrographis paniculata]|uniref:scarecrow-like protein 15 n=1 Tax=Andrographis paniculata TaxID=175694 RepID=UPI0021E8DB81|nr:scarecrow-like protein 15 [Andrographis paniculata]
MKVPFSDHNPPHTPSTLATEPKSVLDLRRSPSPVSRKPLPSAAAINATHRSLAGSDQDDPFADHRLDDWDSLMKELGLNDDSAPVSKPPPGIASAYDPQIPANNSYSAFPDLPPPPVNAFDTNQFLPADFGLAAEIPPPYPAVPIFHNPNIFESVCPGGSEFDDLIRLAECFDTNSLQLGQAILARLNPRLGSPAGEPLQRAAFYFKEALRSMLPGSTRPDLRQPDSMEIIETIKAQKTFSSISPIPMFSSFAANQAVLEALEAFNNVHVVDFDVGLGGQWASFMKALAEKAESRKRAGAAVPALRISAVVSDDYAVESALIRENLTQFARELNIDCEIDFISMKAFEYLNFQAMKFTHGEKVAAILSPAVFRRAGIGFLTNLRQISPSVVVNVDAEGQMNSGPSSYRQVVIEGLEFYSTLLESLEAATINGAGDWMKNIEKYVVFPKILEMVAAAAAEARRGMTCKEALVAAGLRQVGSSQFAEFQAECLLRRVQVRGFHVAKRQAEMLLCWHNRPIVATSSWKY